MNPEQFYGKVAIVTGGSRGIGKQIAKTLAEVGMSVVICGTNRERLQEVQEEINETGGACQIIKADIGQEADCQQLIRYTMEQFSRLDILVNNAGIMQRKGTLETTMLDWQKVVNVNLNGLFLLSKLALKIMKKQQQGWIVNVTSANGVTPHPNASPSYGASKAAVNYLTKHFALEFASENIRVNAVQCGPIESEMTQQWSEEYRQQSLSKIPLGHLGKPQDVANCVLFLVSDEAAYITGTSLNLSGGKLM
ncbi:SDR family NAD(P)-dependent oxidoreductase [Enterococcus sp. AZ109]|uniref:SDR family NAD(P)-dependent oxidoreductase n=1 Tax=Enterococcus sp. AZ109 TaxID=2774634 RepID=UPI003F2828CD